MEKKPIIESAADWEDLYEQKSTRWERGQINPAIEVWLDQKQLKPGRILIPGCGRSPEPVLLAEQGFDVTGLDFAPSAIQYQNKQFETAKAGLALTFLQADVLNWKTDTAFDAVYEQTCLCALQPDKRTAYAKQLHKWLKPGGRLFALFMQTGREGGPPFHCEMADMRTLFDDSDWKWDEAQNASEHSNGKTEFGVILRRR